MNNNRTEFDDAKLTDKVSAHFAEFASICDERLFVILQVYADETATQKISGRAPVAMVAGIAGFAAYPENWNTFNLEWQKILEREHIADFHFSEFIANKTWGPKKKGWRYAGWSEEKRRNFLFALARTAGKCHLFGIGRFVSVTAYNEIIPKERRKFYRTPNERKEQYRNPYYFCFQDFLQGIIYGTRQLEPPLSPEDKLLFMFDWLQEKRWRNAAFDMFRLVQDKYDPEKRMGHMDFDRREKSPPLQAADLLVGVLRQSVEKKIGGIPKDEISELEKALGAGSNLIVSYRDAEALREIVARDFQERKDGQQ